MHRQLRNPHFYGILCADLILFSLAHVGAYLLRFDFDLNRTDWHQIYRWLPWVVSVKMATFFAFGLYRGMWRYVSLRDIGRVTEAVVVSSLLIVAMVGFFSRFQGYSRGVFVLDGGLTFFITAGARVFIRLAHQRSWLFRERGGSGDGPSPREKRAVLVVGGGDAGEKVVREIRDNPRLSYRVVGFVDDDSSKQGLTIHGVRVLGQIAELPQLVARHGVQEVFIAVPSATGSQMRRIVSLCEGAGAKYKTLPGLGDLMDGRVSIKALRDVDYEDLLGRPPVRLDLREIASYVEGKRILVTGGGGSIGSELVRQLIPFGPEKLILVDASEPHLYAIQMELEHEVRYQPYCAVLAKVQMPSVVDAIMKAHRPHVVFHAAAYKHVPLLEENPWEAVFNIVKASHVVMEKAAQYGVERLVHVSTDKAVRPSNVMGASKRVVERIVESLQGNGMITMAVRFGNVVGSSGSVIPLFRRQIARGGPVTVTHPDMTRYFMTIPEAAQLILQAGAMGRGGEIFVLEMGTPVRIADMARDLIRLSGKDPDQDIQIVFTGLRPGEKLREELITEGEGIVATAHEKIMVLKSNTYPKDPEVRAASRERLFRQLEDLQRLALIQDGRGIRAMLKEIVPEYTPQERECVV